MRNWRHRPSLPCLAFLLAAVVGVEYLARANPDLTCFECSVLFRGKTETRGIAIAHGDDHVDALWVATVRSYDGMKPKFPSGFRYIRPPPEGFHRIPGGVHFHAGMGGAVPYGRGMAYDLHDLGLYSVRWLLIPFILWTILSTLRTRRPAQPSFEVVPTTSTTRPQ